MQVDNIIVYIFLFLILLEDLNIKVKQIWCLVDWVKVWCDWMIVKIVLGGVGICDMLLEVNLKLGQ